MQGAIAVIKGGGVIGHHRFLAITGAGCELVIGDLFLAQHQFDARFGPRRISEITFERRTNELISRAARERFHLLIDVGDDAGRVGRHQSIDVGLDQGSRVELLITQTLVQLHLLSLKLFAGGGLALAAYKLLADAMIFILDVFAPEVSAQANLENFEIGGLGNVVISAGVDAFDHGISIVVRRDHDERNVAPLSSLLDALAGFLAGKPRHDEVEQNTVYRFSREQFKRLLAGACQDHNIIFLAKLAGELLQVGGTVVNGEQSLRTERAATRPGIDSCLTTGRYLRECMCLRDDLCEVVGFADEYNRARVHGLDAVLDRRLGREQQHRDMCCCWRQPHGFQKI